MGEYRRNEIVSGLFVCLAIAVFTLFAFRVGGFDLMGLFKGDVLVCRAYFTDVKTLEPGQEVKVGGQPVGKVTGVRMVERPLTEKQVRQLRDFSEEKAASGLQPGMIRQLIEVEFELSNSGLKLNPQTARVSLSQGSLITTHFLDLDPGEWRSEERPRTIFEAEHQKGVVIPANEVTGIEELVEIMKPVVREMDRTLKSINQTLLTTENAEAVGRILGKLDGTAGDVDALVSRIDGVVERVDALLDPAKDARVHRFIDNLVETSSTLKGRIAAVQEELQGLIAEAGAVVADNRAEIAETIRRLNQAMWQANLAMLKIRSNPSVLLFGDDETDFQVREVDESSLRYSGKLRPYGQRDERQAAK